MAPSFLSYIANQHRLKFEDVATDALTHVLRNSEPSRSALRHLLNTFVPNILPEFFCITTRIHTSELGIPDLSLTDESERLCVIIEAKFTAGLTAHQPCSYLQQLRATGKPGMLTFLVPHSRLAYYKKTVRDRCSVEDVNWEDFSSKKVRLFVRLISWEDCLATLRAAEPPAGEYQLFLQDLERMCSVAEPDHFESLTSAEILDLSAPESGPAKRMRNFMKLADEIARRSFTDSLEEYAKYGNAWGASWLGQYGTLANSKAWIGIDASTWSERGKSPIWLIFDGKNVPFIELRLKSLHLGEGYFRQANGNIAIPILLSLGSREDALERCCEQVAHVRSLLTSIP